MLFNWIRERMAHASVPMSQGRNREFRERDPVGGSINGITCYGVALGRAAKGHRLEDPGEEGSHPLSDILRTASLTMVLGAMLKPVLNNTDLAVLAVSAPFIPPFASGNRLSTCLPSDGHEEYHRLENTETGLGHRNVSAADNG